jgi:hypothetical protein
MGRLTVIRPGLAQDVASETFEAVAKLSVRLLFGRFHRCTKLFAASLLPGRNTLLALGDRLDNAGGKVTARSLGNRMRPRLDRVGTAKAIEQAGAHQQGREVARMNFESTLNRRQRERGLAGRSLDAGKLQKQAGIVVLKFGSLPEKLLREMKVAGAYRLIGSSEEIGSLGHVRFRNRTFLPKA